MRALHNWRPGVNRDYVKFAGIFTGAESKVKETPLERAVAGPTSTSRSSCASA